MKETELWGKKRQRMTKKEDSEVRDGEVQSET